MDSKDVKGIVFNNFHNLIRMHAMQPDNDYDFMKSASCVILGPNWLLQTVQMLIADRSKHEQRYACDEILTSHV